MWQRRKILFFQFRWKNNGNCHRVKQGSGEICSLILISISTNNISDNRKIVMTSNTAPGCFHPLEKSENPQIQYYRDTLLIYVQDAGDAV